MTPINLESALDHHQKQHDAISARIAKLEERMAALMKATGVCTCKSDKALHERGCPVAE